MTDATPTPSEQKAETTSLGDLLSEVTSDLSTLMRQELELAKAELKQSATRAGRGAGYAALMAVFFLSVALWWALGAYVTGLGWSAVIVAVIWAIVALVLFMTGRKQLKSIEGAPRTVDSLKRIPDAVKRNEENK